MEVQQDQSYREASVASTQGLSKDEVKKLPSGHRARQYLSVWDYLGVMDEKPDTVMLYEAHRLVKPKRAAAMLFPRHVGPYRADGGELCSLSTV